MPPNDVRTLFAQRAADIADAFAAEVGSTVLKGPVDFRAELVVPDGPSTGGGARAVQHLRLVPASGGAVSSDAATVLDLRASPGQTIVIGAWDQVQRVATLRTWERLAEQYAQRFKGVRLPIDSAAYGKLVQQLETFFLERSAKVEKEEAGAVEAAAPAAPVAAAPSGGGGGLAVVTGFVGLLVGAVIGAMAMYLVLR